MKKTRISRRNALKQLATVTAFGAAASLRSMPLSAAVANQSINGINGQVVRREHEDYEIWRQSMHWHLSKPKRYPDIIVQASSEQDVIAAVQLAARDGHKIAVHSGGHNSTGPSLRNGGMLLDVGSMNDIKIDTAKKIASIQPGVKSIELVTAAREKGLSFPVPHCPSVGLSGFVMGGGIGWNYSLHGGMSCFSIDSADIVTADGRKLRATAKENPELLWAVRGGGPGFFGVVTRLNLRLYPVPKAIMANSYFHSLDDLTLVTTALDKIMELKDDRLEVITLLAHHPESPPDLPPEKAKICFTTIFSFADSEEEAAALLEPVYQSGLRKKNVFKDEERLFSFEGLYDKFFSLEVPAGRMARYAVDNVITDEPANTLHALAGHFRTAPTAHAHVLAGYGLNLKSSKDVCYSSIGTTYIGCYAIWDNEENDEINHRWLRDTAPLMDPFAKGHYVNEVETRFNSDRIRECFSEEAWGKLAKLRKKYDPNGVFHHYLGQA